MLVEREERALDRDEDNRANGFEGEFGCKIVEEEIATNLHLTPSPKSKKIAKKSKDPIFLDSTQSKKRGKAGRPPKQSQK